MVLNHRGLTIEVDGCEAAIFDKNNLHVETIYASAGAERALELAKSSIDDFFLECHAAPLDKSEVIS